MMINRSETCATRKLTQCTDFGVSVNEVTSKLTTSNGSTDLTPDEFRARKAIITQVMRWCDDNSKRRKKLIYNNDWAPILYRYEASMFQDPVLLALLRLLQIVKTAAKTEVRSYCEE